MRARVFSMKRTALRPSRTPIPRMSAKRRAALPARRAFTATLPRDCEIRSESCWGRATSWHEKIKRSHGGVIVPGPKADAQGQVFFASCSPCQTAVEDYPAWARERGFA